MTALVLLGHGSPDPRAAAGLRALARGVARERPGLSVDVAFLDHDDPGLTAAVRDAVDAGHERVVVVPAFLTSAFHVRSDVPRAVAAAEESVGIRISVTAPLGPDRRLTDALERSLPAGHAVVLACAGTRDADAQSALSEVARDWARRRGTEVVVAYAAMADPDVDSAISLLRDSPGGVSVASYVLLPGVLPDRIATAARARAVTCTAPLGLAAVDVVLSRLDTAVDGSAGQERRDGLRDIA